MANSRMHTPHTGSEINQSQGGDKLSQRSMLKVYMANQLELNEAEMEEYEAVVNELAQQLEDMTMERDELAAQAAKLTATVDEKDDAFRVATENWAEEKTNLFMRIQSLEDEASETDQVSVRICLLR
jgi:negative regulator of sigma E activity